MKISETLELAATPDYLWEGLDSPPVLIRATNEWTCLAISDAAADNGQDSYTPAREWYETTFNLPYSTAFSEFPSGPQRQAARKAFLLAAAAEARKQGI